MYYLQSRYYDPSIGRFLNADAYTSTGQGILGNNMFVYCNNNPLIYSDNRGDLPDISTQLGHEVMQNDVGDRFDYYVLISLTGAPLWKHTLNSGIYAKQVIEDKFCNLEVSGGSLSPEGINLLSIDFTAISYRLYSEYLDLALFDFGSLEIDCSLNLKDRTGDFGIMASAYNPTATFHIGDVHITLGAHVGAIGRKASFDVMRGIKVETSVGVGYVFSIYRE